MITRPMKCSVQILFCDVFVQYCMPLERCSILFLTMRTVLSLVSRYLNDLAKPVRDTVQGGWSWPHKVKKKNPEQIITIKIETYPTQRLFPTYTSSSWTLKFLTEILNRDTNHPLMQRIHTLLTTPFTAPNPEYSSEFAFPSAYRIAERQII